MPSTSANVKVLSEREKLKCSRQTWGPLQLNVSPPSRVNNLINIQQLPYTPKVNNIPK